MKRYVSYTVCEEEASPARSVVRERAADIVDGEAKATKVLAGYEDLIDSGASETDEIMERVRSGALT
jgi:hypothetical protein